MTYRDLLFKLTNLTGYQLDCNVNVYSSIIDQSFHVTLKISDTNAPVLVLDE